METVPTRPAVAEQLARRWPVTVVPPAVAECLAAWQASADGVLWVAWSAGADSTALAGWLRGTFPGEAAAGRLRVVHCDHGQRGEASAADAAWVAAQAEAWGLSVTVRRLTPTGTSEGALRTARLAAFHELAAGSWIALGHHADDVLENLLFRTMRGGTLEGLAGMRPVQRFAGAHRPVHLRPLLRLTRAELEAGLREAGQPWRTDATNADPAHAARNALRLEVVPALKRTFADRDWAAGLAALHEELIEADADQRAATERLFAQAVGEGGLNLAPLATVGLSLRRRVLRSWLGGELAGEISTRLLDAILGEGDQGAEKSGETTAIFTVPGGRHLERKGGVLRWREATTGAAAKAAWATFAPVDLVPEVDCPWPGGGVIRIETVNLSAERRAAILAGAVDPEREAFLAWPGHAFSAIHARTWRPGDRYRPLGAPGSRKLQDWFTDRRIAQDRRHQLPVFVAENGEIIWVPGFAPAQELRLGAETERALRLTYGEA